MLIESLLIRLILDHLAKKEENSSSEKNHFIIKLILLVLPFCITLSWSIIMFVKERGRKYVFKFHRK